MGGWGWLHPPWYRPAISTIIACMGEATDDITRAVIGCAIRVHGALGSGFLERIYRRALVVELSASGLWFEREREVRVLYRGIEVGLHRLDLVVEKQVVVELKTVSALASVHYAQVRSYLRAMRLETGLLINFTGSKADFRRVTLP